MLGGFCLKLGFMDNKSKKLKLTKSKKSKTKKNKAETLKNLRRKMSQGQKGGMKKPCCNKPDCKGRMMKSKTKRGGKYYKGGNAHMKTKKQKGGEAVEFVLDKHIGGLPEVKRGTHDCK